MFGLISDCHLEEVKYYFSKRNTRKHCEKIATLPVIPEGVKTLLIGGDLCEARDTELLEKTLGYFSNECENVIYIDGNHEFWKEDITKVKAKIQNVVDKFDNVHYLNNNWIEIDGVKIFGTNGWCDYGKDGGVISELNNIYTTMKVPADCRKIKDLSATGTGCKLSAYKVISLNKKAKLAVADFVKEEGKKIILTHFAPFDKAVYDKLGLFNRNFFDVRFDTIGLDINDFKDITTDELIYAHGHVHCENGYNVDGFDVYLNPRGTFFEDMDEYKVLTFSFKS